MSKQFLTPILLSAFALVSQTSNANDQFQLVAYKNCELVFQQTMTEEQNNAYNNLKEFEQKMNLQEGPLEVFETQMELLSEQMKAVSKIAYVEDGNTITINKGLLEEQETIAEQIDLLVKEYQPELTKLEEYGDKISEAADTFERLMPDEIKNDELDFVRIFDINDTPAQKDCGYNNSITFVR